MYTAKQTSQLHPIPLIKACTQVIDLTALPADKKLAPPNALVFATVSALPINGSAVIKPDKYANTKATNKAPTKLKTQLPAQFLHKSPMLDFPSKTPAVIYITLPVNNSDPQITTIIKPTGNTAPNTNLQIPGGKPAAAIPALHISANIPPNAM